jgi:hypothetical protein
VRNQLFFSVDDIPASWGSSKSGARPDFRRSEGLRQVRRPSRSLRSSHEFVASLVFLPSPASSGKRII